MIYKNYLLKIGFYVNIIGDIKCQIIELKKKKIILKYNNSKIITNYDNIQSICNTPKKLNCKNKNLRIFNYNNPIFKEIDLHKLSGIEALYVIKNEIQNAISCDIYNIIFIHGIGKGILKKVLYNYIYKNKNTLQLETNYQNPGITYVKIKNKKG